MESFVLAAAIVMGGCDAKVCKQPPSAVNINIQVPGFSLNAKVCTPKGCFSKRSRGYVRGRTRDGRRYRAHWGRRGFNLRIRQR